MRNCPSSLLQSNSLPIFLFHKFTIISSACPYFREKVVVVQEGREGRMWCTEAVESQDLVFFFESYLLCLRAMPYVPHLQHSREIRSTTDMVNSSPILQGHMVCSTPPLCGVKVCRAYPTLFSV